jgi:hypothetical protein
MFRTLLVCLFVLLGNQGCASLGAKEKTLLSWRVEKDPEAEEEPKAEEPDEIVTDRPDFTEASNTVGKGRLQLESGFTFTRDKKSGLIGSTTYPEALFRIGMFQDWFEWRIAPNFSTTRSRDDNFAVTRTTGAEDLYFGSKIGLTEQEGALPETALILQTTIPTGSNQLTARRMLPGINFLYSWDVIPDSISVGGSTQANKRFDSDETYFELAQSLTVGYTLTEKLGAYTEFFGFLPQNSAPIGIGPQYYFDGGFTYLLTPLMQFDIRAGVGLNKQSDDLFVGSGFSVKY